VEEGCTPEGPDDWKSSLLVPVYKGKGDRVVCGSYRGIKLIEYEIKVTERVFENRIRQRVKNRCGVQFGYMSGKGCSIMTKGK